MYLRLAVISVILTLAIGCKSKPALLSMKTLPDYPSGSAIDYFNNRFYLIGDDATHVLSLNANFEQVDSFTLYDFPEKRIPKDVKADLEAMSIVKDSNTPCILILGSGSLPPHRNSGWLLNPSTRERLSIRPDSFYNRIRARGIEEINIEGIARTGNQMLLVNRGNKSHPFNHLIITSPRFLQDQQTTAIKIIRIGGQNDTANFAGVSGMDYSAKSDRLFLTVSTENTYNTTSDGEIGKSYLWVINDFASKTRMTAINPDKIIDLSSIDRKFDKQKIESVCISSESGNKIELVLVSDNDNGESTLFRIKIPK